MAHAPWHLFGGGDSGGIFGFDFFGNQGANPRPRFGAYSTHGANTMHPSHGGQGQAGGLPRQTEQQRQDWNQANKDWQAIEDARKKRQEAYEAMAQKTGPTPKGVDVGQYKEAGDPFSPVQAAGGQAPAYESALFGQPRKRRERYRSIVNLRNP